MVRRIVVIGAGAAGLAVLRRFSAKNDIFEIVCFEQLSNVGGLWNYCDNITDPNHPTGSQYTAIYKNMRTNFPKEIMNFDGFPYPEHLPSFISHVNVKEYLETFAEQFQLRKFIRFNKRVLNVNPKTIIGREDVWTVKVLDVHTKIEEDFEFDIVVVCRGQYSTPYFPKIKGMDGFKGHIIHSQSYRDPEEFRGKKVLVVGGGPSGIDISIEIATCTEKTWFSHREYQKLSLGKNVHQIGEIIKFISDCAITNKIFCYEDEEPCDVWDSDVTHERGIHINYGLDNDIIDHREKKLESLQVNDINIGNVIGPIDVIILSTGYCHSFPFLSADCGVAVLSPFNIGPLYKDLICVSRPTLALVGIFGAVLPNLMYDCQAQFLLAFYEGRISMPSDKLEIKKETKEYNALKRSHIVDIQGCPMKFGHFQWFYYNHLSSIANFDPLPNFIEDLALKVRMAKLLNFQNYKKQSFKKGDDGLYVIDKDRQEL